MEAIQDCKVVARIKNFCEDGETFMSVIYGKIKKIDKTRKRRQGRYYIKSESGRTMWVKLTELEII
jgi:hypothetical protein